MNETLKIILIIVFVIISIGGFIYVKTRPLTEPFKEISDKQKEQDEKENY